MTEQHEILKHYIGCDITITFWHQEEKNTIQGKLLCFDIEKLSITVKESINYEIPFEKIEDFTFKGFDDLTFEDCQEIIKEIYSSAEGWTVDRVYMGQEITLKKNLNQKTRLVSFDYSIILKRHPDNSIEVKELFEDRKFIQPTNYGRIYMNLLSKGYLIK